MDGILNIIKPTGMTSHDVVFKIRKKLRIKKVGHTGTLDPNASGVLPICIGQATKISQFLLEKEKAYRAVCRLGIITDTQDLDGKVLHKHPVSVSEEQLKKALAAFQPGYDQLPPMYSALKVRGRKLYEYAREGIEVERDTRPVTIPTLKLLDFDPPEFSMEIACSKGTYIRTLCHDIGEKLGCGGAMAALERTRSGPFAIDQGTDLAAFLEMEREEISRLLFPVDFPLSHYPKFQVPKQWEKLALNGNKIPVISGVPANPTPELSAYKKEQLYRIYLKERFIGIGTVVDDDGDKKMKFAKVIL